MIDDQFLFDCLDFVEHVFKTYYLDIVWSVYKIVGFSTTVDFVV